jgi:hypothetical protein
MHLHSLDFETVVFLFLTNLWLNGVAFINFFGFCTKSAFHICKFFFPCLTSMLGFLESHRALAISFWRNWHEVQMCSSKQNKMLLLLPVSLFFPLKIIVRCFFRFLLQTICGERPWIKILMTDFCFLFWVSSFASISFFFWSSWSKYVVEKLPHYIFFSVSMHLHSLDFETVIFFFNQCLTQLCRFH